MGNKRKRKRNTKKTLLENCQNPFHYLILKKSLEPIHGTCNCASQTCRSRKKPQDLETKRFETKNVIDLHLVQDQRQNSKDRRKILRDNLSGLDYKHNPPNVTQADIRQFLRARTSADIAREEQDRKKRFKKPLEFIFFTS